MHDPQPGIPRRLIAGDTWQWTRSVPGHTPADGWSLKYELQMPGVAAVTTIEAVANAAGTGWTVTVAAADTTGFTTGKYRWAEYLERAGERFTVSDSRAGGLLLIDALSLESQAEEMVRLLGQAYRQLVANPSKQLAINSRSKTVHSLREIREELAWWQAVLESEQNPGRLGPQIAARMQMPGFVRGPFPFHGGGL